jgi:hypothetical protein
MALTSRARAWSAAVITLLIAGLVVALVAAGGSSGDPVDTSTSPLAPGQSPGLPTGGSQAPTTPPSPPPTLCPLTGVRPQGGVPSRPALAVKVENLPTARPQTGLSSVDIVYEEPVEVGITRFIAVYQCQDAALIEPVRSARHTDPEILVQFGQPLLGYSGAVPEVIQAIREAGIVDLSDSLVPDAYARDPARPKPHNLTTSTHALYEIAAALTGTPAPIFTYSKRPPDGGAAVSEAFVPFSRHSDVSWRWSPDDDLWHRYDTGEAHLLSDGSQITASNVIIQVVKVVLTDVVDVNGARSPKAVSTGSGTAYILRGGKMYEGTWRRPTLSDVTRFLDADGTEIPLEPGNTWIELAPNTISVTFE